MPFASFLCYTLHTLLAMDKYYKGKNQMKTKPQIGVLEGPE